MNRKFAVVTGANRGIGFDICRQLAGQKDIQVILTSRDEQKGKTACEKLKKIDGLDVSYRQLDVADEKSIQRFCVDIEKDCGRCDILVNNAGIFPDTRDASASSWPSVFETKISTVRKAMETNVYGPMLLCRGLVPLMKKNSYGRIVNLSSEMGLFTHPLAAGKKVK